MKPSHLTTPRTLDECHFTPGYRSLQSREPLIEVIAGYALAVVFCVSASATASTWRPSFWRLASRLPTPPSQKAWGAVMQRAAREGLIRKVGYAPSASSNMSPKTLWGVV